MTIFNFFKNLFGWADRRSLKRKADNDLTIEKEFITPKRHCYNYQQPHESGTFIELDNDSDSDDIEVIDEHAYFSAKPCNRLNGSHSCREEICISQPISYFSSEKSSSSCVGRKATTAGYFPNKTRDVSDLGSDWCPTLSKTHQDREKHQYAEMLKNFISPRIHVIRTNEHKQKSAAADPEIIEINESDSIESSYKMQQPSRRSGIASHLQWRAPKDEKSRSSRNNKQKQKAESVEPEIIEIDESDSTAVSYKGQLSRRKSGTVSQLAWRTAKEEKCRFAGNKSECVAPLLYGKVEVYRNKTETKKPETVRQITKLTTNTLRDTLAAKAVMKTDFIPEIAKKYNERDEQRYKEIEELKRMTDLLSKRNRWSRDVALEEQLARSMRLCEAILDEKEEPEEAALPPLMEEMMRDVKNALIPRPPDEVLIEGFGLRITRKDMNTLSDLNWLNDEVINYYMNLLIARSAGEKYPNVYAMNTFFYPKLLSGGHSSLKRWTRKVDIFAQDLVVVPVHLGIHWCMSIIDFRDKTIRYYDSMGSSNQKCLSALKQYLEDESFDKKKKKYDTSDWKLLNVKDIPQQMNGSDCGVFSCVFAEHICANRKINFTQQDMPYFRNKMVYEILNSKLL